jgi:linoleoyl-CoA desaturase
MEKVKFRRTNSQDHVFAKIVKERVNSYFKENNLAKTGNFKLYFKTVIMMAAYIVPFILLLVIPMPIYLAILLAILMGIGEAGIGMSVMHDGAHGSYSSKKWVNKLASSTIWILGSTALNWKIQHNVKHHTYTNIFEHDEDIDTKGVVRLCEHAPLKKYNRLQHIYAFPLYGLMTLVRFVAEIYTLIQYNKSGLTKKLNANPRKEVIKLILTKFFYILGIIGLPLLLTDYSIWQILGAFVIMHLVAGMIMSLVFQMAHVVEGAYQPVLPEDKIIHKDWAIHQLKSTSDFGRKNGLFSWYIGGLDFQIEHHLFQNISHVHYPVIAPIVEATAKEFGLEYNLKSSVFKAVGSHYRRIKALGRP